MLKVWGCWRARSLKRHVTKIHNFFDAALPGIVDLFHIFHSCQLLSAQLIIIQYQENLVWLLHHVGSLTHPWRSFLSASFIIATDWTIPGIVARAITIMLGLTVGGSRYTVWRAEERSECIISGKQEIKDTGLKSMSNKRANALISASDINNHGKESDAAT